MELKQLIMQRPAWLTSSEKAGKEQIVLSTHLELKRNLAQFPFPSKASIHEKSNIFKAVTASVEDQHILGDSPLVINLTDVSDIAKTVLFERDYITLPTIHSSGDRGIIVGNEADRIVINSDTHITITRSTTHSELINSWKELDTIDTLLGKECTYAFNDDQGFLLSRADQCGTGLSAIYTLHLPGLVHTGTLEQVLSGAAQLGIAGEGKFRNGANTWGALFTLRGGVFAGSSEEEILQKTDEVVSEIIVKEKEAREKLFEEAYTEMEDKIWRSYGVLRYARMLSVPSLLNLTSTLRLGVEQGMGIDGLTLSHIDSMIASALQGSIALLMDTEAKNSDELDIRRAEVVRTIIEA